MRETKKELVFDALDHKATHVVPCDVFEGWMWPDIGQRLLTKYHANDIHQLHQVMGAYCIWLSPPYIGPALPPGAKDRIASPHSMNGLNACIWGLSPGLKEHGQESSGHPLAAAETKEEIINHPWPSPDWFDYSVISGQGSAIDRFVVVGGFTPIFYLVADLCGMEKALIDISLNPSFVCEMTEKITDFYEGYITRIAAACEDRIDAIAFGDDFSSQLGMLMSPDHWRRYFMPCWRRLFSLARKSGYKVFFHSCGSMAEVIPDLIEIGLDVLYPVQPKARSMELARLGREFGRSISFYGGFDVQEILPFGSVHDIRREVERLFQMFSGQGGYVLSTSHVIMDNTPEENAVELYTTIMNMNGMS